MTGHVTAIMLGRLIMVQSLVWRDCASAMASADG